VIEKADVHDCLADLLLYPREGFANALERCRAAGGDLPPEAREHLTEFEKQVRGMTPEQLEESFVGTFDLNPACVLEVGWHLYGDNYDRGAFLVKMRESLRRCGVPESTELPDHLRHILALLGRLPSEDAAALARDAALPAVEKMLAALAGTSNPYENVLKAVRAVVAAHGAPVRQKVKHD